MFPQLLFGCVQRQQDSSHESFAVCIDDCSTEEEIPVGLNRRPLGRAEVSSVSCSADGSGAVVYDQASIGFILQDTMFLQQCTPSDEGHATAATAHEADPFHDDWPYWDSDVTSTSTAIRHFV
jgi:hypothetical protein